MKLTKKEEKVYDELLVKWCVDSKSLTYKQRQQLKRLSKKRNNPTKEQAAALATQSRAFYLFNEAMQYWTDCVKATNKLYNS